MQDERNYQCIKRLASLEPWWMHGVMPSVIGAER